MKIQKLSSILMAFAILGTSVSQAASFTVARNQIPLTLRQPAEEDVMHSRVNLGVGVYEFVTVDQLAINTLHAWLELSPKLYVGAGFGTDADFGSAALFADLRYDFIRKGAAAFFGNFQAGWRRLNQTAGNHVNGLATGILGGFDYAMTENLHASFAYGLQIFFASDWNDHVGLTNNGWQGNFGLHWFL